MEIFVESPTAILLIGLFAAAGLGIAFLHTGDRRILTALGGVAVVVAAGIALERYVTTDREQIAETLDALAAALRADGLPENHPDYVIPAVKEVISESAGQARGSAETNLRLAKITGASYSNLRVKVNKLTSPPTAEVQFDARVSGEGRGRPTAAITYRAYPLEFDIRMRYENGRWLIADPIIWRVKTLGENVDPRRYGFDTGE